MILYPILILLLLITAFIIAYRRAYILERSVGWDVVENNLQNFNRSKKTKEPEVSTKKEQEEHFRKAEDLFYKKQYVSAEKWFIEAAKINPKNDTIYARLGIIYIEQKNYKDAAEALEESIRLQPNIASRHFNLSFVRNALGDKKRALEEAKKAVRLDSGNEKYRKWLDEIKSSPF